MQCVFADNQEYGMSGCESGWTLYLEHSSISPSPSEFVHGGHEIGAVNGGVGGFAEEVDEEYEDDDLSMVSDASSGPPHLRDEDRGGGGPETGGGRADVEPLCKRIREKRRRNNQDQSSLLDDTASSTLFDFSDKKITVGRSQHIMKGNDLEYSQGYSSTHFEVIPPYPGQYDFFQPTEIAEQLQQGY